MATEDSVFSVSRSAIAPPSGSENSADGVVANMQNQGSSIFRRQRALRACVFTMLTLLRLQTCHARKVRCDAVDLGVPCTNCTAFGVECNLLSLKRNKLTRRSKDSENREASRSLGTTVANSTSRDERDFMFNNPTDRSTTLFLNDEYTAHEPARNGTLVQLMKPKLIRALVRDADKVANLGSSSSLSLRVRDEYGSSKLDSMDIKILRQRGAFLLPPRLLCDKVIDAYFKWVAPIVPVINRSRFMRQYMDQKNPPSLLLLQAILLAGSRVCSDSQLMDSSGSTTPAAMTFYKRAKALFDSNYEDDPITNVQALLLIGWYWEGPEDVTKNVYYWTRVAILLAQDSGMHRSVEGSGRTRSDKRLWKRIWWTLFSRDRSVAVALGRPVGINLEYSDVEMITADDFIEGEPDEPAEFDPDPVHVQFFINYVKLCEIMGLILSRQYSVASKFKRNNAIDLTQSDMALADWIQHCLIEVPYDKHNHSFWAALLHAHYYTVLCLLHRAHIPPANVNINEDYASPSRIIAYQAAGMITSIIECLQTHNEIQYTPAFIVYSLFSALIMHVSQMRSSNTNIVVMAEKRLHTCMIALNEVSKNWLVAKMVHTLFESILHGQSHEERSQKAAHNGQKRPGSISVKGKEKLHKSKSVNMDLSLDNGVPDLPVSNEILSCCSSHLTTMQKNQPQIVGVSTSINPRKMTSQSIFSEDYSGAVSSRDSTKPATPINTNFTYPETPTEMVLVTGKPPRILPSLWQSFHLDQLFPMEINLDMSFASAHPTLSHQHDDLQLFGTLMELNSGTSVDEQNCDPQPSLPLATDENRSWTRMDHMSLQQRWEDDTWVNSTKDSSIIPTTLDLEDWLNFFGIHGDATKGLNSLV